MRRKEGHVVLGPGQTVAHYRIDRKIGEGGMGEVWAATDTRLNRSAAIKALPVAVADDGERLARFRREAQLLAALNHPNIASIYGLEQAGGRLYLALELVEGDDLSARIGRRPVPVDEALEIALQIAAALEEAHDKGIVHRDLKPANIKMTSAGKVKVLDFGLAKALAGEPTGSVSSLDLSASPTMTGGMGTQAGLLLGTAAYMAPEQARGKAVDRRADIWAFGVILYEMLTGSRLFPGETVTDVIAAVVTLEPDWDALPPETPPAVRRVLRRCLQKDSRARLRDIGDAALELREAPDGGAAGDDSQVVSVPAGRRRGWLLGAAGLGLGAILGYAMLAPTGSGEASKTQSWSNLAPPAGADIDFTRFLEISPDGRRVVFAAPTGRGGKPLLWVRDLGSEEVRPLPGTEDAYDPFWSPDSRSIGYFAGRKLRRIEASGGVSRVLADAGTGPRGASWGADGTILYVPDWSEPVYRISASGGAPEMVTKISAEKLELSHRWPQVLPGDRTFLYFAVSTYPEMNPDHPSEEDQSGLYIGSFDGAEPRLLQRARSRAVYRDGSLLYVDDGILMARPFDLDGLSFTGEPVTIASKVTQSVDGLWGGALFSVSDEGTLLFVRGAPERSSISQLTWRDREGRKLGTVDEPRDFNSLRLSHDGTRAALGIGDPSDVWIYDLTRGNSTRFTFDPGHDNTPIWSPDDAFILFASTRVIPGQRFTPGSLFRKATSGLQPEEYLAGMDAVGATLVTTDWSPDGKNVASTGTRPGTGTDLLIYPLGEKEFDTLLQSEDNEEAAKFSPNGQWLAYESDESGQVEIYVRAYPGAGGKWQISSNGGWGPTWRADGRALFYVSEDGMMMSVTVESDGAFRYDRPVPLFEFAGQRTNDYLSTYDVTPDGDRFLIMETIEDPDESGVVVTLVRGWR
jgi:Tol biopolymer transport system component